VVGRSVRLPLPHHSPPVTPMYSLSLVEEGVVLGGILYPVPRILGFSLYCYLRRYVLVVV